MKAEIQACKGGRNMAGTTNPPSKRKTEIKQSEYSQEQPKTRHEDTQGALHLQARKELAFFGVANT